MATTLFMKTSGVIFVVEEDEEQVVDMIANAIEDDDSNPDVWVEFSSKRPEREDEDGGNGDGTITTALHVRLREIMAVGG